MNRRPTARRTRPLLPRLTEGEYQAACAALDPPLPEHSIRFLVEDCGVPPGLAPFFTRGEVRRMVFQGLASVSRKKRTTREAAVA